MKTILILISIFSINSYFSQQINVNILTNRHWGQINDTISKHRGKSGLIIMKLNSDHTFKAFENTDYGAATMQKGTWSVKNNIITFNVKETINYSNQKKLKGKILSDKDTGKIKYEVKNISEKKIILYDKKKKKELIFELSEFKYGV